MFGAEDVPVSVGDEDEVLLGARPVAGRREHLITGQHQLDRAPDLAGCDSAQHHVHPQEALGPECSADQRREDSHLLLGDTEVGSQVHRSHGGLVAEHGGR